MLCIELAYKGLELFAVLKSGHLKSLGVLLLRLLLNVEHINHLLQIVHPLLHLLRQVRHQVRGRRLPLPYALKVSLEHIGFALKCRQPALQLRVEPAKALRRLLVLLAQPDHFREQRGALLVLLHVLNALLPSSLLQLGSELVHLDLLLLAQHQNILLGVVQPFSQALLLALALADLFLHLLQSLLQVSQAEAALVIGQLE